MNDTDKPMPSALDWRDMKPNSYEGKPRHLSAKDRGLLEELTDKFRAHINHLSWEDVLRLRRACLHVSPINCGWQHFDVAQMAFWMIQWRFDQEAQATAPTSEESSHE